MDATQIEALKRPIRWLSLVGIAILGVGILLVSVAYVSAGSTEFKSTLVAWLDEHHLYGPRRAMLRAAKRYERANPVEDARHAIAEGDFRMHPAAGLGEFFPGVSDEDARVYRRRFGVKDLLYAGCVVDSDEEERYRTAAFNYAVKYNQTVLAVVKR